jgi:hypothetical protein
MPALRTAQANGSSLVSFKVRWPAFVKGIRGFVALPYYSIYHLSLHTWSLPALHRLQYQAQAVASR